MLANDLKPNRLEALKKVASTFVQDRVNDRIGLVVYAGESYTRTPVTSDKAIILQSLKTVAYDDSIIADGTGIGVGLATAINRIKDSKAKSRIVILLTDGVNNSGTIDPRTAADIAKEYGIKVYTIGIGTNGKALFPVAKDANGKLVFRMMPVEIDEKLMQEIAKPFMTKLIS
jgi:Ca-activated chloride channel family protein